MDSAVSFLEEAPRLGRNLATEKRSRYNAWRHRGVAGRDRRPPTALAILLKSPPGLLLKRFQLRRSARILRGGW